MKTKQLILLLSLLLVGILLAACGGGDTISPEEPTQVPESVESNEAPSAGPQEVSVNEIQNISWQWAELIENNPASQSMVADPENYTLAFFEDGTFSAKVDCNSGNGTYTVDGNKIEFGPMPLTMALCPPESLHDQFLQLLGEVDTFGISDDRLVFVLMDGAGEMRFQNGGMAEKPAPAPEEITLFVGPEKVACEGEGPQECYQVRETTDGEWQLFYDEIEGFEWEPGYIYELRVNGYQVENPPAGGSSLRYELVEVVSKTPAEVENVTGIDPDSVTIDVFDLPYTYQPNLVAATPYDNSQPPGPMGLPQHIQINFGVTSPADAQPGDPLFYIIPKAAYLEMWDAAGDPGVENTMSLLEIALTDQTTPIPTEGMPVLPNERVTGYNDLAVQGRYFTFDKGYGARFVGRFNQDPNPVTNDGLYYVFQGFSQDGNYLFSFFYPVETGALPNSSDEVSEDENNRLNQDGTAYMAERAQALNALALADWLPSLETLDSVVSSLNYVSVFDKPAEQTPTPTQSAPAYDPRLVGIAWEWARLAGPASELEISDPELYTLLFANNGSFSFKADCNTGSGTYTTDSSSISMSVNSVTQAACDEESLSDRFIRYLGNVTTYVFDGGRLVLNLKADGGNLIFNNGGTAVTPPLPGAGSPTATILEPINVRSGPGKEYDSYGVASIGDVAEIIGKSADSSYWVIKIPTDIASDGRGWVIETYVKAENAENVPVIEAP